MGWLILLVLVIAAAAGAAWWWQRRQTQLENSSSRNDRYNTEEVISQAQTKLYSYLQDAFPNQAVLFAQPLSHLVSVRYAENRQRADERLHDLEVDFVVCGTDGRPQFAFQVDAFRPDEEKAARRQAAIKHRVLATAGVRLLWLKKSVHQLPPPKELRQRLMDAETALASGAARPGRKQVLLAEEVRDEEGRAAHRSDTMSLTDLMNLSQPTQPAEPDETPRH